MGKLLREKAAGQTDAIAAAAKTPIAPLGPIFRRACQPRGGPFAPCVAEKIEQKLNRPSGAMTRNDGLERPLLPCRGGLGCYSDLLRNDLSVGTESCSKRWLSVETQLETLRKFQRYKWNA